MKTLLVVDYGSNFHEVIKKGTKLNNGEEVHVEQVEWKDLLVKSSSSGGAICFLKKSENPLPFSHQKDDRVIKPDFVFVRNFPRNIHEIDYKSNVIALMFGHIPGTNSLESLYMCMERPLVYAELAKAIKRLKEKDPQLALELVPMNFHPNEMIASTTPAIIPPEHQTTFPMVVKVSSTHAGYGKAKCHDEAELKDLKCILALHKDYYTTEPFVDHEYEYRIQKIGNHYRAFRRNSDTSWKGNWGNLTFLDHPWEPKYQVWVDECAKMFGGMDLIALDILHTKDGRDVLLELNDAAFGLMWEHEAEDLGYMRELILQRMNEIYSK